MALAEILQRNRAFLAGRAPQALPPPQSIHQLILACYDPRLDDLLHSALGLDHGDAFLVRSAGAVVTSTGDPLRSIALAVYLFDVKAIAVVGHTSCRMAAFETSAFIDLFRRRGVRREAFGHDDLRVWAGAIAGAARGVQSSVAVLREAPCLPRDLEIGGLVLDDATGELEVVVRPDEVVSAPQEVGPPAAEPAPAAHGAEEPEARREPEPPPAPKPAVAPKHETLRPGQAAAADLARLVAAAASLVQVVESHGTWRYELRQLRAALHAERSSVARMRLLDGFVRKAVADSREAAAALERLKREAQGAKIQVDEALLLELLRRAIMGEKG
jgi:carbonic anhydrase